ncbi:nucleotidyltransferase domain-containing protein [Candidatus Pacearchaeota archaeon]|nr:nucleotidyltransferase domain-containing protein [Candidatus Pacearchaeota archaeon]
MRIERAYLFGSYARGTQNRWSDVDIAVVSPDFSDDGVEERYRLMKVACTIDDKIEPVPFRPEAFSEENPLAWEIMKGGLRIDLD